MNPIITTFLCLLAIAAILFVLVMKKNAAGKNGAGAPSKIFRGTNFRTWWVIPTIFWVILNAIVLWYFNPLWEFIWRKQLVFWVLQAGHFFLLYRGHVAVNGQGRPEEAWYPGILAGTLFVTVFLALLWGEHREYRSYNQQPVAPRNASIISAPAQTVATEHSAAAKKKPLSPIPSVPELPLLPELPAPPQVTSPAPPQQRLVIQPIRPQLEQRPPSGLPLAFPFKKTTMVYPMRISSLVIPAGYHVAHIDGLRSVLSRSRKLPGGGTEFEFKTLLRTPVEVTIWYEQDRR